MIKIICVTYPLVPCNGTAPRHLRQAGLRNLRIKEDQSSGKIRFFLKKKVASRDRMPSVGLGEAHDMK